MGFSGYIRLPCTNLATAPTLIRSTNLHLHIKNALNKIYAQFSVQRYLERGRGAPFGGSKRRLLAHGG